MAPSASSSSTPARCRLVDTSIESDHERFSGFLKVSLEEVIVALRDDRCLPTDSEGLASGQLPAVSTSQDDPAMSTLYPSGFDAARFVAVIEDELVWEIIGRSQKGCGQCPPRLLASAAGGSVRAT